jgi:hypothetical protein
MESLFNLLNKLQEHQEENEKLRAECGYEEVGRDYKELYAIRPKQASALNDYSGRFQRELTDKVSEICSNLHLADDSVKVLGLRMLEIQFKSYQMQIKRMIDAVGRKEEPAGNQGAKVQNEDR